MASFKVSEIALLSCQWLFYSISELIIIQKENPFVNIRSGIYCFERETVQPSYQKDVKWIIIIIIIIIITLLSPISSSSFFESCGYMKQVVFSSLLLSATSVQRNICCVLAN